MQAIAQKGQASDAKVVHILSSGLKAGATWSRVQILQLCRECCGGMGFLVGFPLPSNSFEGVGPGRCRAFESCYSRNLL